MSIKVKKETKKANGNGKAQKPKVELSRYGHRVGSAAAFIADLLFKGIPREYAVKAIGKWFS